MVDSESRPRSAHTRGVTVTPTSQGALNTEKTKPHWGRCVEKCSDFHDQVLSRIIRTDHDILECIAKSIEFSLGFVKY